jgi:hypothetical protein
MMRVPDLREQIDMIVWNLAVDMPLGGSIPTDVAIERAVEMLAAVWDVTPKPDVRSGFDGDLRFLWHYDDRLFELMVSHDGEVAHREAVLSDNGWDDEWGGRLTPSELKDGVEWVYDTPDSQPEINQEVADNQPRLERPKSIGVRVLESVVDGILPRWAKPAKGPIVGATTFMARQVAKIPPSAIDKIGNSIKGKISASRRFLGEDGKVE